MNSFPLQAFEQVSSANPWTYLVFLLIGFGFGYVLEISGFGNSKKLAAQFYFRELTVLKVMFGAIVTAMVLMFTMIGLGVLDYSRIFVNPTYLASGILGGLIMGVGFIVGGFCPGTSLVAAVTGKIDGMFFVAGGLFGIFLFGETERYFDYWWNHAGSLGRLTLMDVFGLPAGVVVTLVVFMALFMFWGSEQLERIFGGRDLKAEPRLRVWGAAALAGVAVLTIFIGTPSLQRRYEAARLNRTVTEGLETKSVLFTADELLMQRLVQISPAELFHSLYDQGLTITLLDVRPEADFNLYHLRGAQRVDLASINDLAKDLIAAYTPNRVIVLMSNDEQHATEAWKALVANSVSNVYLLEGGINAWIAAFGETDPEITPLMAAAALPEESLRFVFPAALGDRYQSCRPSLQKYEHLEYEPKIQLQLKRDKSGGGCG